MYCDKILYNKSVNHVINYILVSIISDMSVRFYCDSPRTLRTTLVYIYRENLFMFAGLCQLPLIMYLFIERICLFLQDFVNYH